MTSESLHTTMSSRTGLAGHLKFLSLILLLVVFTGTSLLAKVESSSSVANFNHGDY